MHGLLRELQHNNSSQHSKSSTLSTNTVSALVDEKLTNYQYLEGVWLTAWHESHVWRVYCFCCCLMEPDKTLQCCGACLTAIISKSQNANHRHNSTVPCIPFLAEAVLNERRHDSEPRVSPRQLQSLVLLGIFLKRRLRSLVDPLLYVLHSNSCCQHRSLAGLPSTPQVPYPLLHPAENTPTG